MSHDVELVIPSDARPALPDGRPYADEMDAWRSARRRPARRPGHVEQFAAVVRGSPCATNQSGDYADARYYLDRAVPAPGSTASSALAAQVDAFPGVRQCLTATNLAELAAGTHLLAPGTLVQVFALYPRTGAKLYVFNQPPALGAVVEITGAAGGAGKYTGRILGGASSAAAGTNLAMTEGMSLPGGDDALILNVEEDGLGGHRLALPCYAVGQIVGRAASTMIVMIRGALGSTAGPTVLGNGSAGSVAPDPTSWTRAGSATPLSVWAQTRTLWDSAGGVLYAYLRNFSFDARGLLVAVSGETQLIVDTPTACT